jgi:hypothetical protein
MSDNPQSQGQTTEKPYTTVSGLGDKLTTEIKPNAVDLVTEQDQEQEEKEPREPSQADQEFSSYMMSFAKANYKKIISPNGKQIKINGIYYTITVIVEEVEDVFNDLENKMNRAAVSGDTKKVREALYNFLTFACNISREQLKNCDRGEIKNIALILGMMQKGFRDL